MSSSNTHHIVLGDPTHPDCEICKKMAAGIPLTEEDFPNRVVPSDLSTLNRAERRALRKITRMAVRMPSGR